MTKTYELPALLAAALSTDRPELARLWAKDPGQEIREVGELLADLLEDRRRYKQRVQQLRTQLRSLQGTVKAAEMLLEEAEAAIGGVELPSRYVIRHQGVADDDGEPEFWNNENGWVDLDSATVFPVEMIGKLHLPVGGVWEAAPEMSDVGD